MEANPDTAKSAVYLLDYELLGYSETGLSLAEEFGLGPRAALVTSRYEEEYVLAHCMRLKMKLLPKGLAGHIPVNIMALSAVAAMSAAVLIDDDPLVRMNWKAAARGNSVKLMVFSSPEEFYAVGDVSREMDIYIDSDLGGGVKGEEIAKDLKDKGYINICLETGYPLDNFAHLPWLKVTGKEPPWGA